MIKSITTCLALLILILGLYNQTFASSNLNTQDVFTKYNVEYKSADNSQTSNTELQYVNRLPDQDYKTFTVSIIKLVLGLVSTLCFISISVAGIMFVLSEADSEMQTKAKNIIKYSLYGIVVIALSYSLVYGLARIDLD